MISDRAAATTHATVKPQVIGWIIVKTRNVSVRNGLAGFNPLTRVITYPPPTLAQNLDETGGEEFRRKAWSSTHDGQQSNRRKFQYEGGITIEVARKMRSDVTENQPPELRSPSHFKVSNKFLLLEMELSFEYVIGRWANTMGVR